MTHAVNAVCYTTVHVRITPVMYALHSLAYFHPAEYTTLHAYAYAMQVNTFICTYYWHAAVMYTCTIMRYSHYLHVLV